MKVIIDPGHCVKSPGAVAFGTTEKSLNLIYSQMLASKLEKLGISVDRSVINDNCYSSVELTDIIKRSEASLCISCHQNAFNGTVRGFEVIHSIHSDGRLSGYILEEVKKTGFPVRRAFSRERTNSSNKVEDYYYVIRLTYPEVETIIVEFGFMDNADDFKMLRDPVWQEKLTAAVAEAVFRYLPPAVEFKTQIIGKSILTPSQLKRALADYNSNADAQIVDVYYNIAAIYNVKADLAFLQAMNETGWLTFGGRVKPEQNNFAGLGAYGGSTAASFPSVQAGVEAHIQHLFAYATTAPIPSGRTLVDPRFHLVKRGSAPNWEDLNGKWAVPGVGYGERIVNMQKTVFNKYPPESGDTSQDNGTSPAPPVHWAKPCNDELMEAGLLYNDHSQTLNEPATEGMVICLINRLRKEFLKNE